MLEHISYYNDFAHKEILIKDLFWNVSIWIYFSSALSHFKYIQLNCNTCFELFSLAAKVCLSFSPATHTKWWRLPNRPSIFLRSAAFHPISGHLGLASTGLRIIGCTAVNESKRGTALLGTFRALPNMSRLPSSSTKNLWVLPSLDKSIEKYSWCCLVAKLKIFYDSIWPIQKREETP